MRASERVWHPAWLPRAVGTYHTLVWWHGDRSIVLLCDGRGDNLMQCVHVELDGMRHWDRKRVDGGQLQHALRWLVGDEDESVRTGDE